MAYRLIPPQSRKGNRFWTVRGTFQGRRFEASTGKLEKAEAEKWAVQFVSDVAKRGMSGRSPDMTLAEVFAHFADTKFLAAAEQWRFERLMARFGQYRLAAIDPPTIERFGKEMYPRAEQAASRNRNVATPIASLLHFAAKKKWTEHVVVPKEKEIERNMPAPTEDEMERLISAADGGLRFLLIWLAFHGQRIGHALALEWSHIDLEARVFRYLDTKAKAERELPIHRLALAGLSAVPVAARKGRVFPYRSRWAVYKDLRKLEVKTGIRFRPHDARRGFARTLEAKGVPTHTTREAGGWKDLRSVGRYIGKSIERVRAATAVIDFGGGSKGRKNRKPLRPRR